MDLYLITYRSILSQKQTLRDNHKELLEKLDQYFVIHIVSYTQLHTIPEDAFTIPFIATGGVENMVKESYDRLPYRQHILADGLNNSLAASMEIASWLHQQGEDVTIIHGTVNSMVDQVLELQRAFTYRRQLSGKRIGIIGEPSSWLIASSLDKDLMQKHWGIELVDLSLDEVCNRYNAITDEDVTAEAERFIAGATDMIEGNKAEVIKAMRMYRALKDMVHEHHLDAFTLACFTLLDRLKTTGCLSLALLNDEGVPAGCEGDMMSILTLLVAREVFGTAGFMCNPTIIDDVKNEIMLAHCTIGLRQTQKYIIRSHFESLSGIAIQGIMPQGDITIFKMGGSDGRKCYVSDGQLIENCNLTTACRTQIRLHLDKSVDYFTKRSIGNHHIVLLGHHAKDIERFCHAMEVEVV